MSQVTADLDAINQFRQALLILAARLREVLVAVDSRIAQIESSLALAEERAVQEVYYRYPDKFCPLDTPARHGQNFSGYLYLRDELQRCWAAAAYGYPIDCDALQYELRAAESHLDRILAVKRRLHDALRWYDSARNSLETLLVSEFSQDIAFLDRRISALEAYHATQLLETATTIAASGIWQLMGVLPPLLRQSQAAFKKALGNAGEEIAAVILSRGYGLQELVFTQPAHGFDRVFAAPGLLVIVVESKVSSRGKLRLGQTVHGE